MTQLEVQEYSLFIVSVHFQPPIEDNLLTKDKRGCPKVSFTWRFHSKCCDVCVRFNFICSSLPHTRKETLSSPLLDKVYYTDVKQAFEGDTYFPEWNRDGFEIIECVRVCVRVQYARGLSVCVCTVCIFLCV